MSHYISISIFKGIVEEKDVLDKALSFCQKMLKNSYKEISDSTVYFPSYEDLMFDDTITPFRLKRADVLFIESLFSYKFIYWKDYKLLGVVHDRNDDEMHQLVFQNSCDQNTDFEEWYPLHEPKDPCRDIFRQIVTDTVFNKNTDAVRKYYLEEYDDEEIDPTSDYYKKTYVYKRIEDALNIVEYIYDNISDECNMLTFRMAAHISDNEKIELRKTAIQVFKDNSKELEDKVKDRKES